MVHTKKPNLLQHQYILYFTKFRAISFVQSNQRPIRVHRSNPFHPSRRGKHPFYVSHVNTTWIAVPHGRSLPADTILPFYFTFLSILAPSVQTRRGPTTKPAVRSRARPCQLYGRFDRHAAVMRTSHEANCSVHGPTLDWTAVRG